MAKKAAQVDRFTVLAGEIASPDVIDAIDKALEENERERSELLTLRQLAVVRHGVEIIEEDPPAASKEAVVKTISELAHRYQTNSESPYQKVRYRSRTNYGTFIKRILADCGDAKIADLNADDIKRFYTDWKKDGHFAMARGLLVMFRMLIKYGAIELKDQACGRFYVQLRSVEFPLHRSQEDRNVPLEPEQITAIIKMAHEMEKPSIALAQAFYSDCGELEQKDILGEWVPKNEPGESDVTSENEKWICGIRWEEIDADFVLRHQTSREGKIIKINLERRHRECCANLIALMCFS